MTVNLLEFSSVQNKDRRKFLDRKSVIKSLLDDLFQKIFLSKDDYKYLKPFGSKPGVIYGICKIHKGTTVNDLATHFQPNLSAIGTCSYNFAKFLYQYLNSLLSMNTPSKIPFHFVKN